MNPLTLIEQADKQFSEKFVYFYTGKHEHQDDWKGEPPLPSEITSHFHQLLLFIAKGECERLAGKMAELPSDDIWNEVENGRHQVLSDSLEHWESVVRGLEKKV